MNLSVFWLIFSHVLSCCHFIQFSSVNFARELQYKFTELDHQGKSNPALTGVHKAVCQVSRSHTHSHFTALWTLSGTAWVSWYQKVHFAIFWIFWCKMKITQADTPAIRMDCHLIQTNWCPHLCHPHHFYAGCPSWHSPPKSIDTFS